MIDAIVTGKLFAAPASLTSKAGNPFAKVRLLVGTSDGGSLFVSLVCFDEKLIGQLLALDRGDSLAVAATLTPKAYLDRNNEPAASLDGVIHHITTPYHISRKRQLIKPKQAAANKGGGVLDIEDDPL